MVPISVFVWKILRKNERGLYIAPNPNPQGVLSFGIICNAMHCTLTLSGTLCHF